MLNHRDPNLDKGLGFFDPPTTEQAPAWNLLREDLSLPAAVLHRDNLLHNLRWMQQFIDRYGVKLAPHGKTTMAPRLFHMQLEGGAWGITLATAHQTHVAHAHGVKRVLMANQLVGRQNMALISRLLQDPDFEFYCLVDSPQNIDQLAQFFSAAGQQIKVLIELGVPGGRAGVRSEEQLKALLTALDRSKQAVALCGVELYEGVLTDEPAIRAFLYRAVELTRRLLENNSFERTPAILSGAGSAWYDVVAEVFSSANLGDAVELVLRPGCYLTHDIGIYREAFARILERNPVAQRMQTSLQPALQIWAYVQSIPEPTLAIIAMGKRDAAFDSGLPAPALHYRPGNPAPTAAPSHWHLTRMMDQHAYLAIQNEDDLQVGDMIGFDISHPCLTFDKWRAIAIVDKHYQVTEIIRTFF